MTYPYIIQPDVPVPAVVNGTSLVSALPPAIYPRLLTRISIKGPAASTFEVHRDAIGGTLLTSTNVGNLNTVGFIHPIMINPGTTIYGIWPNLSGSQLSFAALATFFLSSAM